MNEKQKVILMKKELIKNEENKLMKEKMKVIMMND